MTGFQEECGFDRASQIANGTTAALEARDLARRGRDRLGDPRFVRVVCSFGADDTRTSYATDVSLSGAFVLSRRPPSPGATVSLQLCPPDAPPLPPIDARVVGIRIDAGPAARTGFAVAFSGLDDGAVGALAAVADRTADPDERAGGAARRPTVPVPGAGSGRWSAPGAWGRSACGYGAESGSG